MSTQQHHPPKWAHRFLEWYCTPALLEDLEGDLHEYFNRNVEAKGLRKAQLIYIVDVIKFIRLYTIKKPQPYYAMNKFIMYQNYYKASIRNIKRNKLFSFINIVGLAISMSVGVLLITLLAELKSYDKFHKHVERIYRVNNLYEQTNEGKELYASTSILAGKKIKESISGIDDVTIVRGSFDKDVTVGDKVIPLEGLWADDRFLSVFSFDVIAGNPQTALRDLYSVVLTESSANKVFGTTEVVGKQVGIDTLTYTVQAVIQDPPFNSHLRFEMLGSLVTLDTRMLADNNHNWMSWRQMWQNYVYVLLPEHQNPERIETSLSRISAEENKKIEHESIELRLQPLTKIVLGEKMSNQIGPNLDRSLIWILTGLAFVVIISACFNYTNLSIARALRRTREVGIRKVVGATRRQVFSQFMVEAVLISLFSMLLSYPIFALIRPEFIAMDISLQRLVSLQPEGSMYLFFIVLAVFVGLVAGFLPALFFSRMNSIQVLKDIKNVKLFRHLNFRKTLIVFQYTLSLLLIVIVSLGYKQYKYSVAFDLGLTTKNVLNVAMQQNKADLLINVFKELPEVSRISKSIYVSSIGDTWSDKMKYDNPQDSVTLYYNYIDSAYIPLHDLKLLAGSNLHSPLSGKSIDAGIIINEKTLQWMGIENPADAIGEEITLGGEKLTIKGVVEDFHYNTLNFPIGNFAFRYYENLAYTWAGVVNLKIQTDDLPGFMDKLEAAWKKVDPVHPIQAEFYDEKIAQAYDELVGLVKIIGFLAFLAISIASLGLLGIVVSSTESRFREISIRKVFGATKINLIYLVSRSFILLLLIASAIAIPAAYYLFDAVIFENQTYRTPVGFFDLFAGSGVVIAIALLAIGSQTIRVARSNPAEVLKNE